jgi:hypothetical protein
VKSKSSSKEFLHPWQPLGEINELGKTVTSHSKKSDVIYFI